MNKIIINDTEYTDLSRLDIYGQETEKQETANSYVISKPGNYCFPLVYGCAIKNGEINSASYTSNRSQQYQADFVNYLGNQITSPYIEEDTEIAADYASILIGDDVVDGSIIDEVGIELDEDDVKYVCFTIESIPETGANYVIGILDIEDRIMWSWHIWLWKRSLNPVTITNYEGNEYRILPVNLGTKLDDDLVHMKNWFYQWGRKDPMLLPESYDSDTNHISYGSTSFSIITTPASSVDVAIKNPCTFYTCDTENWGYNNNWVQLDYFYNYWDATCNSTSLNEKEIIKTVYDPCPPGYSIPNARVFTGFTTTGDYIELGENVDTEEEFMASINVSGSWNSGWNFKTANGSSSFFPAGGYRNYTSGGLTSVGSLGNYWSAGASSSDSACYLGFYSSGVLPLGDNNRARGFSVRPVKYDDVIVEGGKHLIHLHSGIEDKLPSASQLEYGEIAVNYNAESPMLCIKDSEGDIRVIGEGSSSTDTWRDIKINNTSLLGTGTDTGSLNLKSGTCISVTNDNGSAKFDIVSNPSITGTLSTSSGISSGGNLNMNNHSITNLTGGTQAGEAVTYEQALIFDGNTYDAGNNRITSVSSPRTNSDAATKKYVDDAISQVTMSPTILQDTLLTNLNGTKEFNVAYIYGNSFTPPSMNFTTGMNPGTVCHVFLYHCGTTNTPGSYSTTSSINFRIPNNIDVGLIGTTSYTTNYVWINGEMTNGTAGSTTVDGSDYYTVFTVPVKGMLEISIFYSLYNNSQYRTIIKVDSAGTVQQGAPV